MSSQEWFVSAKACLPEGYNFTGYVSLVYKLIYVLIYMNVCFHVKWQLGAVEYFCFKYISGGRFLLSTQHTPPGDYRERGDFLHLRFMYVDRLGHTTLR